MIKNVLLVDDDTEMLHALKEARKNGHVYLPRHELLNEAADLLGVGDQTIFPEINMDTVQRVRGMNVTIVIKNARSAKESKALLEQFGMPFRKRN
mgnify:CR=1 FL=1